MDETTRANTGVLDGRAAAALAGMETLRAVLQRKVAELVATSADVTKPADMSRLLHDLGKAITLAVAEEGKVADALSKERGGDGLDLDAARAEIGRRLDRIRGTLAA